MWSTFDCALSFHRCSGVFFLSNLWQAHTMTSLLINSINKLAFTHGMWSAGARSERFTTSWSFRKSEIADKKKPTGKISPEKSIGLSWWAWQCYCQDTCRHFAPGWSVILMRSSRQRASQKLGFQTITRSTMELDAPLVYAFNCSVMHCWSRRRAVLFESNRGQCWAAVCSCGKHLSRWSLLHRVLNYPPRSPQVSKSNGSGWSVHRSKGAALVQGWTNKTSSDGLPLFSPPPLVSPIAPGAFMSSAFKQAFMHFFWQQLSEI